MSEPELVVLATFGTSVEAALVARRLEDHGLEVFLREDATGVNQETHLLIAETEREIASQLLDEWNRSRTGGEDAVEAPIVLDTNEPREPNRPRRRLTISPAPSPNRLLTLMAFETAPEAYLAAIWFRNRGVNVMVHDEFYPALVWQEAWAVWGVKLSVWGRDLETALDLLTEFPRRVAPSEEPSDPDFDFPEPRRCRWARRGLQWYVVLSYGGIVVMSLFGTLLQLLDSSSGCGFLFLLMFATFVFLWVTYRRGQEDGPPDRSDDFAEESESEPIWAVDWTDDDPRA